MTALRADQAPCCHCDVPLKFTSMGWLHDVPGGGLYAKRCTVCQLVQAAPAIVMQPDGPQEACTACGSTSLADDHCAHPDRS